jgi:hypothetical protein
LSARDVKKKTNKKKTKKMEAEIRRIEVQCQPAPANSSRDPSSKILITKKGWQGGLQCRP